MKLYKYDSITKEFVSEIQPDIDPLETKKQGKTIYLIPSNTTDIKPEDREGYTPIYSINKWEYVKDNRNKLAINLTTKVIEPINYLGEVKDGWMLYDDYIKSELYIKDQFELEKNKKINENATKRNVEFISTPLGKLKTTTPIGDLKTAIVLYDKLVEVNNGLPEGYVRLYDKDGNIILSPYISKEEYNNIVATIAIEYNKIDMYSTYISNKINNCTSIDELKNIIIDYDNIPNDIGV